MPRWQACWIQPGYTSTSPGTSVGVQLARSGKIPTLYWALSSSDLPKTVHHLYTCSK